MNTRRSPTSDELERYVEEVALFFEESGLPRIAGRILGRLLVCDPAHQSAAELADSLGVSKASISTMTRMLVSVGLVERHGIPADRTTYFRLVDDGFEKLFDHKMRALTAFLPLADRGLEILEQEGSERSARLRHVRQLYGFFHREMGLLLEKWRRERGLSRAAQMPDGGETS